MNTRKVCIANRNIGQKFVFLKNKYISVILAFVVCSIKLVTSVVGISLPLIFCIGNIPSHLFHIRHVRHSNPSSMQDVFPVNLV